MLYKLLFFFKLFFTNSAQVLLFELIFPPLSLLDLAIACPDILSISMICALFPISFIIVTISPYHPAEAVGLVEPAAFVEVAREIAHTAEVGGPNIGTIWIRLGRNGITRGITLNSVEFLPFLKRFLQ